MAIKLICEFAKPNDQVFTGPVIKIGKLSSSHLKIEHDDVSRMHAVIEGKGKDFSIVDLGSHGGTFVNGRKVNKSPLVDGDMLTFGESVTARVYIEGVAEPRRDMEALKKRLAATGGLKEAVQGLAGMSSVKKLMESLADTESVGEAGGGLVKVSMQGTGHVTAIEIDDLVMDDKAMLQDLLIAAFHDAQERLGQNAAKKIT